MKGLLAEAQFLTNAQCPLPMPPKKLVHSPKRFGVREELHITKLEKKPPLTSGNNRRVSVHGHSNYALTAAAERFQPAGVRKLLCPRRVRSDISCQPCQSTP